MKFVRTIIILKTLIQMSKWNKVAKQPTQQFLQNEERRRQMIIEASKRRREKEKKLEELNQNLKRNQIQALEKHKREKQEVYSKYLKNNMHDKYEQAKRNEKLAAEPKRQVSKWKRKQQSEGKSMDGFKSELQEGLVQKNESKEKQVEPRKGIQSKKAVAMQFQKEWCEQQQISDNLIDSKLLDSLDLDLDTLQRGRQLSHKVQQLKKNNELKSKPINKDEVEQIRNLIGYESMLASKAQCIAQRPILNRVEQSRKSPIKQKNAGGNKNKQKQLKQPEKVYANQQQIFNNLKHKKEAKILDWVNNNKIVEEVDDLFSNCSSNKNPISSKQVTKDRDNLNALSKKALEPIIQKKVSNKSISKEKEKKQQKPVSNEVPLCQPPMPQKKGVLIPKSNLPKTATDKFIHARRDSKELIVQQSSKTEKKIQIASEKNVRKPIGNNENEDDNRNKNRSVSKDKVKENRAIFQREKQKSLQRIKERKFSNDKPNVSVQKQKKVLPPPVQVPKTQQPFRSKNIQAHPTYTVATHEQYFDVQSFIKQDLLQLNEQERKIQQQIRKIHLQNKEKLKDVQSRYNIQTNYKNSKNLINRLNNNFYEQDYAEPSNYQIDEQLIEDSIQRLDDLLIKRDIQSRQKTNQISEQSYLQSDKKSLINPFSRPEDLHKQILQLASNISKFEKEPAQMNQGYSYQQKIKKIGKKPELIPEEISVSRNMDDNIQKPDFQGKKSRNKIANPPLLEYSSKNAQAKEYDMQDSLQTMSKEKIQVNQKLKNILFDD